jgi:lipopolysaccharide biosynthesis protein
LAYLADNPDVSAQVLRGRFKSGFDHFLKSGYSECLRGERRPYLADRLVRLHAFQPGEALARRGSFACLFAHYDADGLIDDYVVAYLSALRALDVDIYFITAVDNPDQLKKVSPLARGILIKNDAGRDFGSWWLALRHFGLQHFDVYDRLILCNDSIYFPVADAAPMFSRMQACNFNFWGITDSHEFHRYHIQSYFMVFDRKARAVLLNWFMRSYEERLYLTKQGQIVAFELNLARIASEEGLSVGAYCAIDDIREELVHNPNLSQWRAAVQLGPHGINPCHDLWDVLILNFQSPVLKIELLRDNPKKQRISRWERVVGNRWLSADVISAHLRRTRQGPKVRSIKLPAVPACNVKLRKQIEGMADGGNMVLFFAHYDPEGFVDDHVIQSISAMRACACDVVFITSTECSEQLAKAEPYCKSILVKSNAGRDFGSWYIGTKTYLEEISDYDAVIWMNDSTYFPLFDLHEMFASMRARELDFWGVVDSYNLRWHVMSWFWFFGKKIVDSDWFANFVAEYNPRYSKWDQIRNYETRYPSSFVKAGLRVGAYVEADKVHELVNKQNPHVPKNFTMTHQYWDLIITRFRCPALKVELLRDNPIGMDTSSVFDLIREHTDYRVELIRAHLMRVRNMGRIPDRDYAPAVAALEHLGTRRA